MLFALAAGSSPPEVNLDSSIQGDRFYRTVIDVAIECDSNCHKNGDDPFNPWDTVGQRLEMCGEDIKTVRADNPNGPGYVYTFSKEVVINGDADGSFTSVSCPPGEIGPFKFKYWNGNNYEEVETGGSLVLYPHDRAKYISVLAEEDPQENALPGIDKPPQLYSLKLDKEGPDDVPVSEREAGDILIMDLNPADNIIDTFGLQFLQGAWNPLSETISVDFQAKEMETGTVLNSDSYNFNRVLRDQFEFGDDCISGDDEPCNTAMKPFETKVCPVEPYSGAGCGPNCALAHSQKNYCSGSYSSEESEKLFTVTSSLIVGWRYPEINQKMCPDGFRPAEDCKRYTEIPLDGGPPRPSQLSKTSFVNEDGELVIDGIDWSEPLRFHTCGQNLELLEGKTVYSPSQNGPNQFRCDPDTGNWKQVNICNDGVDNDEDGKIDGPDSWYQKNDIGDAPPDPECVGGGTSEYKQNCYEAVVAYNSTGGKNAFYEHNPNGKYSPANYDCSYEKRQEDYGYGWAPVNNGVVQGKDLSHKYTCNTETGEIAENPYVTGNPPSYSKSDLEKNNIAVKYLYFAQQNCQGTTAFDSHGDEMLASISQVPKKYLPTGPEFAGEGGFHPFITQTVREAEDKYFGSTPTRSELESRGIEESDTQPYQDPSTNEVSETWTAANLLAPYNDRVAGITLTDKQGFPLDNFPQFTGGLAGKCPEGEVWAKPSSQWECRESSDYPYILPDVREGIDSVGVKVPGMTLFEIENNYDTELDSIRAECWRGTESDKPAVISDSQQIDSKDVSNDALGYFITLAAEINTGEPGQYSCNFSVTTSGGEVVANDQSLWSNWWDRKSEMEMMSQKVHEVVDKYSLSYERCFQMFGVPCDTFKNLSTIEQTVAEEFYQEEGLIPSQSKIESKEFTEVFEKDLADIE